MASLSVIAADTKDRLRINDNDWPPYFFGGKEGSPKGLGKELLHHCLLSNGYDFTFSFYPINRMHKYMASGILDINVYSYKPERGGYLLYNSEPLFTAGYRPVVRVNEKRKIQHLADFDPLLLGHLHGLRYSDEFYQYVMAREERGELVTASDSNTLLTLLNHNRIDVFVSITESVRWTAKSMGLINKIKLLDYDVKTAEYFVTISKQSPRIKDKVEFLNSIDACLVAIKQNGLYNEIVERYKL